MAKIHKNSILQGISGSLGELIIRRMRNGSTRVRVKPVRKQYTFNQKQKGLPGSDEAGGGVRERSQD